MYRILLPVDEDEARARAQAEAVVELPGADEVFVDVVHVHEEMSGPDAEWAAGGFSDEYAEEMEAINEDVQDVQRLPKAVETAVETFESEGVEYAVHEATGDAAETILGCAGEYEADGIVIGVQKRSPVGKVLFGSVAQAVILDSDRPVTVVPPN